MTLPPLPPAAQPPSLFSGTPQEPTTPSQPAAGEGMRMLSGLETKAGRTPTPAARAVTRSPVRVLAGLLVLAVVAVTASMWLGREQADEPAPNTARGGAREPLAVASAARANTPADTAVAPPLAVSTPPAPATAVIERLAQSEPVGPAADAASAITLGEFSASLPRPPASSAPATASAGRTTQPHVTPAKEARPAASMVRNDRGLPIKAAAEAPDSAQQSDVDVLAAMVAHLEANDRRRPAKTVAQKVRTCSELGRKEGEQCRQLVCANHWGKDAACPMRLAPKHVRPRPAN